MGQRAALTGEQHVSKSMSTNIFKLVWMFCWIAGVAGLAIATYTGITGHGPTGEILIVPQSNNFFIRYSLQLMMVSLSMGIIMLPILVLKGYLGPKEMAIEKYDRAKGEFILSNFAFSGMFFAFLCGSQIGNISTHGKLVAAIILIYYLYIAVKLVKAYKSKKSKLA